MSSTLECIVFGPTFDFGKSFSSDFSKKSNEILKFSDEKPPDFGPNTGPKSDKKLFQKSVRTKYPKFRTKQTS